MDNCIKIASRTSILAKIQAKLVGENILQKYPDYKIEYHWIKTTGDAVGRNIKTKFTSGISTPSLNRS